MTIPGMLRRGARGSTTISVPSSSSNGDGFQETGRGGARLGVNGKAPLGKRLPFTVRVLHN